MVIYKVSCITNVYMIDVRCATDDSKTRDERALMTSEREHSEAGMRRCGFDTK
jgi:hypothetical protein